MYCPSCFVYITKTEANTHSSGAQPEMFQGWGGCVELGHFDKLFVKNSRKKVPQGKILELFLLDTLKTAFLMEDSTQGWIELGPFFQNQGTKKGRDDLPPPSP